MKELYIEGLASHNDRESCVDNREVVAKRSTAEDTGIVLSLEKRSARCRRFRTERKATPDISKSEIYRT